MRDCCRPRSTSWPGFDEDNLNTSRTYWEPSVAPVGLVSPEMVKLKVRKNDIYSDVTGRGRAREVYGGLFFSPLVQIYLAMSLPCLALPCHVFALPCFALRRLALLWLAMPCHVLPCFALSCLVFSPELSWNLMDPPDAAGTLWVLPGQQRYLGGFNGTDSWAWGSPTTRRGVAAETALPCWWQAFVRRVRGFLRHCVGS